MQNVSQTFVAKKMAQFVSVNLIAVGLVLSPVSLVMAESNIQPMKIQNINSSISFEQAIHLAQQNDPWLTGNKQKQKALLAQSVAAAALPDPKVSIGLANLPTDTFEFNQEGMTQLKVGVAQMFPRGDTLAIKQQQLQQFSEQFPFQRQDRRSKIAVTVGSIWLDSYLAQQSIALIKQNYFLFQQLTDIAQANYSSALGKARQQDIVRAQLVLTRLDDRVLKLQQQQQMYQQKLTQWLSDYLTDTSSNSSEGILPLAKFSLSAELPDLSLQQQSLVNSSKVASAQELVKYFYQHPAVKAVDHKIIATKTGINLAKQKYQPEWGVNASYAYRDGAPAGSDRADLLSVGVTFDLPLFTENKQDQEVAAAVATTESVKTERILLLREFMASFASNKAKLQQLNERDKTYQTLLLPQTHMQAEASLTAYTNDDGDFAEVVRAKIDELNTKIEALTINIEQLKTKLLLNYLTQQ